MTGITGLAFTGEYIWASNHNLSSKILQCVSSWNYRLWQGDGKMKGFFACLIIPTILLLLVTLFVVGAFYFFVANLLEQYESVNESSFNWFWHGAGRYIPWQLAQRGMLTKSNSWPDIGWRACWCPIFAGAFTATFSMKSWGGFGGWSPANDRWYSADPALED